MVGFITVLLLSLANTVPTEHNSQVDQQMETVSPRRPLNCLEIKSLELRATLGDPIAQYELGIEYLTGHSLHRDIGRAIKHLTDSAENGYARSAFTLGLYYGLTESEKNYSESLFWLKIAYYLEPSQKIAELIKMTGEHLSADEVDQINLKVNIKQAKIKH